MWAKMSGPLLAIFSFAAYQLAFRVNALVSPWSEYAPGVSLVFIPAGVKLIALLVAGWWGLAGLAVAALLMASEVWSQAGWSDLVGNIIVWLGVPFVVVELSIRWLKVRRDLKNLTFLKFAFIATAATLIGGLASAMYAVAVHGQNTKELVALSLAMALGDMIGIGLIMILVLGSLSLLERLRSRRP